MEELTEIRSRLDRVDTQMVELFEERMALCRKVAEYKIAHGLPVLDASREEAVLDSRAARCRDESLREDVRELYREIMRLSRGLQQQMVEEAEKQR